MSRQAIVVVFLVALAVRCMYLAVAFDGPESLRVADSELYESAAAELSQSGKLAIRAPGGEVAPVTERVPGYMLFLAAVRIVLGDDPLAAVLVQLLLDAATCVVIAATAGRLSPRLAVPTGVLTALNLNLVVHAGLISPDSMFLLLFSSALYAVVTYFARPALRLALGAGVLFGVAWLIGPVLLFFTPLLVVALAAGAWQRYHDWRPTLLHSVVGGIAMVLVAAPTLAFNLRDHGHLSMTSQIGSHALDWVVPLTLEYGQGVPRSEALADTEDAIRAALHARHLPALPDNPFAASAVRQEVAVDMLANAGIWTIAKAWSVGVAINLMAPSIGVSPLLRDLDRPPYYWVQGVNPAHKIWLFLAADPWYAAIVVPAAALIFLCRLLAAGAVLQITRGGLAMAPTLFLLATAAYVLIVAGPVSGPRFRLAAEPCLDIFLAVGLLWLADVWRRFARSDPTPAAPLQTPLSLQGPPDRDKDQT